MVIDILEYIDELEGLTEVLEARGYACSISVDTNYLEDIKED